MPHSQHGRKAIASQVHTVTEPWDISQSVCTSVEGLSLLVEVVSQDIAPTLLPPPLDHFFFALGNAEGRQLV